MICSYFPRCAGCSNWDAPYQEEKTGKLNHLKNLLNGKMIPLPASIDFASVGEQGLRHRVDFTIQFDEATQRHAIGFYDHDKKIMLIESCLQLSPELQKVYSEFINFRFFHRDIPIRKASARLRVGPTGLKGCWLDFANLDVKNLLEDGILLNGLLDAGFIVEIGQKGKRLHRLEKLKLADPKPELWFKTVDSHGGDLALNGLISDFTQPSWLSARALVETTLAWTTEVKNLTRVVEFGAGLGQFTLSFLKKGLEVRAYEISAAAGAALALNAEFHDVSAGLSLKIGDYHKENLPLEPFDLAFVNPARSGLKNFTNELIKSGVGHIIYVSCFPESLVEDVGILKDHYEARAVKIVDQFPRTSHYETCVFLRKSSQ